MRPEKTSMVNEIRANVADAPFVVVTNVQGMGVAATQQLRAELRKVDARLSVVKNRLLDRAVAGSDHEGLTGRLAGQTGVVASKGDAVQTAKVLKAFMKTHPFPVIQMASLEGAVLSAEDVDRLADLPSREQLYGMLVGTLAAPMTQLAGVLHQKLASLVYVLQAAATRDQDSN